VLSVVEVGISDNTLFCQFLHGKQNLLIARPSRRADRATLVTLAG
jgi:hypothetical protein